MLAAAGLVEGWRANRWGPTADLAAAAARLDRVPREVGPWVGSDLPLDPKVLTQSEAVGAVSRAYRHRATGAEVAVLVLCGPPGPIAAHTPTACYAGLGYEQHGREVRRTLTLPDGTTAGYWSGRFGKGQGRPGLEVCWAWAGADGKWVAADSPRKEFLWNSALHKLYAIRNLTANGPSSPEGADPLAEFLTAFLPELRAVLSPPPD